MRIQHVVSCPTRTIIQCTSSQHILQDLIDSLGLPIYLRMERCIELQPSAQGFMQLTPKLRSKLSTSIRHYLAWNSMQTNKVVSDRGTQTLPCLELHANKLSWTYKSW